MPFLYLAVTDTLFVLLFVFGLGFCILCRIGEKVGFDATDTPSTILSSLAIGLYVNSIIFAVGYYVRANFSSLAFLVGTTGAQATVAALCLSSATARTRAAGAMREALTCKPLLLLAPVAFCIGVGALYRFPHVFDSIQVAWTQSMLAGTLSNQPIQPMLGFSALIALPAALTPELPLVTSAAGFKPFLMVLALLVACQATYALDLRPRVVAAAAYLALMVVSTFGTYGLIATGKDSIFGILFLAAMLIAMSREDAEDRGFEIGAYLAAASLTGIIAVPYAGVAYGLWLLFSFPKASRTLPAVYLVNLPTLPLILGTFARQPYFAAYLAFLGLGLAVAILAMVRRRYGQRLAPTGASAWMTGVIWLAIAGCAVLLPIAVEFEVARNIDGTPELRSMPPVDGRTGLVEMFAVHASQGVGVVLGVIAVLFIGLTPLGRRRPGLVAAGATSFVSLLLVLLHHKLGLQVLSPFNTWDLSKDVPMWLGGALISLFAVVGVSLLGKRLAGHVGSAVSLAALLVAAVWYAYPVMNLPSRQQPMFFNAVTGSRNPDMALISKTVWEQLRGKPIYVYKVSPLAVDDYFFSFQMFGASTTKVDAALNGVVLTDKSGFVVAPSMVPTLLALARSVSASVTYVSGTSTDVSMLLVENDGKGATTIPSFLEAAADYGSVEVTAGDYSMEVYDDGSKFSWMKDAAEMRVVVPGKQGACVTLGLFATTMSGGDGELVVARDGKVERGISLSGTNIRNQTSVSVSVPPGLTETTISVSSSFPAVHFPNDSRPIAFGMRRPVPALPPEACRS